MGRVTAPITYDLRTTGRDSSGSDRGWDIPSCVRIINSAQVQEAVKRGDLLGYYGHLPRTLAKAFRAVDGAVVGNKYVTFEYATRVRSISCSPDGIVTHTTEFLDTDDGRKADRADAARAGGFSSVMTKAPRTSPAVANGFFGFDYVGLPNYDGNRSYRMVLDSMHEAGEGDSIEDLEMVLDMVGAEAHAGAMAAQILADVMPQYTRALQALEVSERERAVLIDRLARSSGPGLDVVLDSVHFNQADRAPRTFVAADLDDIRRFGDPGVALTGYAEDEGKEGGGRQQPAAAVVVRRSIERRARGR